MLPLMKLQSRTEEREALAAAIGKHQKANDYHDIVADAHAAKEDEIRALWLAMDQAESNVARAKNIEGKRLVAIMLHGPGEEPSLEDCEAALAAVKRSSSNARNHSDTLSKELEKAVNNIGYARTNLQRCLRAVVIVEGGVLELRRRYDAVCVEAKSLQQALSLVSFALPGNHLGQVILGFTSETVASPLEDEWRAALAALESDPDAPLPEIPN